MNALERLRNGLFVDSPKYAKLDTVEKRAAVASLRKDANELANDIVIELVPMCHNKSVEGKRLLLCSKCGAFTKVTNATENIAVRYCGNCGSKVVDDESNI